MPKGRRASKEHDLIELHRARSLVYRIIGETLTGSADGPRLAQRLATAGDSLGGPSELTALAEVLAAAEEPTQIVLTRCGAIDNAERRAALARLSLESTGFVSDEVRALSELARDTAAALGRSDLPSAVELSDLQARLLGAHAAECLNGLSAQLMLRKEKWAVAVGKALHWMVAHDGALFEPADGTSKGSR